MKQANMPQERVRSANGTNRPSKSSGGNRGNTNNNVGAHGISNQDGGVSNANNGGASVQHRASSRPDSRSSGGSQQQDRDRDGHVSGQNHQVQRKVVGNYMLSKTIGEGTFGKVKLAIHLPTGEKVAIKILEKSKIKEQSDVRRVNREIKILKKSRHSNIIQMYEVLDTQNSIYLIMECAEGGEMFDYIVAHRYVNETQACKFFHQIIDGIDTLHKNEITHRDLKPENLLLKASSDGWLVKIVDFGLSNTHEGGKLLNTACGSPCYAAPEMIAGKQYEGPLADLWSIGVILFALVCGYLPFEDPNTSALYRKILSGDYKTPKWLSPEVKDIIRKILETDPRKRFRVADIRNHPWYKMISPHDVPKEYTSPQDAESIHQLTIKALTDAGMDVQAVLEAVASHTCNSSTAMYYMYEQKFRLQKLKAREQGQNLNPNTADASKVSAIVTSTDITAAPGKIPSIQGRPGSRGGTGVATGASVALQPINGIHANNAGNNNNNNINNNSNISNVQQIQQQSAAYSNSNKQSGHGRNELVIQDNSPSNINSSSNNSNNSANVSKVSQVKPPNTMPIYTPNATPSEGNSQHVPISSNNVSHVNNSSAPVVIPALKLGMMRPGVGGNAAAPEIMTSQTSRPQSRGATGASGSSTGDRAGLYPTGANAAGPQSARLPEPTSMLQQTPHLSYNVQQPQPVMVDQNGVGQIVQSLGAINIGPFPEGEIERPNTRRSRVRSRGGDRPVVTPADNKPGEGLIPTLPTETVNSGFDNSVQPEVVISQGGGFIGATIAPISMSVSNNDNNNSGNGNSNNKSSSNSGGETPVSLAYGVARAPDLPQRSGSSQGGRKGRNLVTTGANGSGASSSGQPMGVNDALAVDTSNSNSNSNSGGGIAGSVNMNNSQNINTNNASPRDLALRNKNIAQGSIGAYGI